VQTIMTAADKSAAKAVAALLVVGDKVLSGRTKDKNIGYIAEYLTALGVDLKEVRVVGNEETAIVDALNALRHRYAYVFTTGGIGPTHDDITSDCVAKAFEVRMTRIPKGANLVLNEVSGAPGFWIDNVIVMAGVPSIMQAMLDQVGPKLKTGIHMLSETVRADARESDISSQLAEIVKANPGVAIGSHPFFDPQHGPNTSLVLRASDPQKLQRAKRAVEDMLQRVQGAQSSSA
jgi:molybdenum cofactor synthesis domain-containing protein